jgi:hypothetical protein
MNANTSNTAQEQRIRKVVTKGNLEVIRVHATTYQKEGTLTAEIKQTVTTKSYYPSKSVSNNMQDNPFSTAEFGFSEKEYSTPEKRVAWLDVPVGSTVESVIAKLSALPTATIMKTLANRPIVTDSQNYAIGAGLTTLDAIADKQVVRYPEGSEKAGQLILDANGKVQYKANFFKNVATEDSDLRTKDVADFYATAKIKAELAGANASIPAGQDAL